MFEVRKLFIGTVFYRRVLDFGDYPKSHVQCPRVFPINMVVIGLNRIINRVVHNTVKNIERLKCNEPLCAEYKTSCITNS